MTFRKYNSIDNSYRTRTINDIRKTPWAEGFWCITEKIHGTNMTWIFNRDGTVEIAKRSGVIPEDELVSFFRADLALKNAKEYVVSIGEMLTNPRHDDWEAIRIVGEWYGGGCTNTPRVQAEVDYGDTLRFAAFDIFVDKMDGTSEIYDVPDFLELTEYYGIPIAPIIAYGITFDEALAFDVENFHTTIGPVNGLAEGVVIKPHIASSLPNGKRIILKKKHSKFKEKDSSTKVRKERKPIEFDGDNMVEIYEALDGYFTHSRYDNMIGNLGEGEKMPTYIKYFVDDVLKSLREDLEDRDIEPSLNDFSHLQKYVGKTVPKWLTTETNILSHIN